MTSNNPHTAAEAAEDAAEGGQLKASTLELFFDLVFVFTITQLTHAFTHHPGWQAVGQIAIMFGVIWWMYDGYVWLTNEVAPNSSNRRTFLLVGMFGFFVLALAIPDAFTGSGLAFGLAYVLVNTVHTGLFAVSGGKAALAAVLRLAPLNAVSAGLVLGGGLIHGWPRYLLWTLALVVQIVSPYLMDPGGFTIRASHFCERHGLVVIVALGESVVAMGVGLAGMDITVGLIAMVAISLTLGYVLWWAYFGLDDERGEHALSALPGPERARPAVLAYGYSLYLLMLGIILTAAGIKMTIAHGNEPASAAAALALSGGVALFFLGQCTFRLTLKLPRAWFRLLGAVAVLATAAVGTLWVAWGQLVVLVVVAYGFVIADDIFSIRSGDRSSYTQRTSFGQH
ncbi:low temperature requirement protein A [Nocardia huaxiensis]|uniref:Low temperature requirement protein A n=1 Tax=Nocardia huaxiensis TaxID=2755382 RepID=A0A7D6VIV7_9NOCA|nr:low temperature requirement protein A [Nocardia huaxiensis]QLY33877.1 low temperature requirement protein A [Nocardia huaxiensis]UFS99192.1 low temperature requirement protein A [Nocardia huaxiensis]